MGCEPSASSRDPSQDGLSLVGKSCSTLGSLRPKSVLVKSMNSAFIAKKILMLSPNPVAHFVRISSLPVEKGRSKLISRSRWITCRQWAMARTCWSPREYYSTRQALSGNHLTTQIEALNCRLRHYLTRLHRKMLCYSKSKTMLEASLKLLIHKLNKP